MILFHPVKRYRRMSFLVFLDIILIMSVVFTIARYTSIPKALSADNGINNPGAGLPEQPAEPTECTADEQQHSQDQQSGTNNDQQAIQQQHDQLDQQLQSLNQQMSDQTLSADQKQAVQTQMDSVRAQMTTLEQQSSHSDQQPQSDQQTGTHEPSADCKAAIVRSAQSNLGQYKSIINSQIIPTLDRVNSASSTVEASIPHFREIGVSEATITQIQTDIATIRTSSSTLRGFFTNVISKIDAFLSKISDPNTAFNGMKNGFSVSDRDSASKAGDNLVTAFDDLQKIIDGIKE